MSDRESQIIRNVQAIMGESNIRLSQNDALLFLVQAAAMAYPVTLDEARQAIERHWDECPAGCSPVPPPKCAMGLHLKWAYGRLAAHEEQRLTGPPAPPPAPAPVPEQLHPASAAAASVAAWQRGEVR